MHFRGDDLRWLREQRRLGVGYRVRVRISTAEKPEALVVPRSALFRGTGQPWQVYASATAARRSQTVQIGILNDKQAEIPRAWPRATWWSWPPRAT